MSKWKKLPISLTSTTIFSLSLLQWILGLSHWSTAINILKIPRIAPILRECSQYMYAFIQSVLDWFVPLFVHKYTEEWKVWPPSLSVPPERKRGTCAFPVWCGGWEVLGNAEPFFSFASSSLHCRAPLFFPVIILHLTDHPPSHSLNHSSLSLSNFVKSAS